VPRIYNRFYSFTDYEDTCPKWNNVKNKIFFVADLLLTACEGDVRDWIEKSGEGPFEDALDALNDILQEKPERHTGFWNELSDDIDDSRARTMDLSDTLLLAISELLMVADQRSAITRTQRILNMTLDTTSEVVDPDVMLSVEIKWRLHDCIGGAVTDIHARGLVPAFEVLWPLNPKEAYRMAVAYMLLRK